MIVPPSNPDVTVTSDSETGILTIALTRSAKKNAITLAMVKELTGILSDKTTQQSTRALVLKGDSGVFCAGADIALYAESNRDAFINFTESANKMCEALSEFPAPVIASVDGVALGGGFELVLCTDLVIASETSTFGLPEVNLGLLPGWGGSQRLTERIGPTRSKGLTLTGARLGAQLALEWGLVNIVCSPQNLLGETLALADVLAAKAPLSLRAIKSATFAAQYGATQSSVGFRREQELLRELFDSADGQEGIRAFVEKRTPMFTGS